MKDNFYGIFNKYFSIKRFFAYFYKELFESVKFFIIFLGVIFGIILLNLLFNGFKVNSISGINNFIFPLTLVCLIFTSVSFPSKKNSDGRMAFLLLPVSSLEKLLSKILLTFFAFFLISIVSIKFMIISADLLVFITSGKPFNLNLKELTDVQMYVDIIKVGFIHSCFFLGSLVFKDKRFLKTVLSIIGGVFVIGSIGGAIIGYQAVRYFGLRFSNEFLTQGFDNISTFGLVSIYLFTYILPVLFYVISFFQIKNMEAR